MRRVHVSENKIILSVCVLVVLISLVMLVFAPMLKKDDPIYWEPGDVTGDNTDETTEGSTPEQNQPDTDIPDYFQAEIEDCINKLNSICTEKSFVFAVVTDTHYTGDNNWLNTKKNIEAVNSKFKFDAIYHLGDLIDGDLDKADSAKLITEIRNDLYKINPNSFLLAGNHDNNSFYSGELNADSLFSKGEWYSMFGRYNDVSVSRDSNNMYWYQDIHSFGIRVIALDSIAGDNIKSRLQGYSDEQVEWVKNVALDTDYQVLFLSHMPLTQAFNYANHSLSNGNELYSIIENFKAKGGAVIGHLHGHTHWDNIGKKNESGFYEISTGCAWTSEWTSEYKPDGAVVQDRKRGSLLEDLWDIYVIQPETRTVKIIRFGAGEDRDFSY